MHISLKYTIESLHCTHTKYVVLIHIRLYQLGNCRRNICPYSDSFGTDLNAELFFCHEIALINCLVDCITFSLLQRVCHFIDIKLLRPADDKFIPAKIVSRRNSQQKTLLGASVSAVYTFRIRSVAW